MDTGGIIFGSIIASAVWLWILYMIIKGAINSSRQTELMEKKTRFTEMNLRLLAESLKKQGVTEEQLREIIDLKKSYFVKEV